MTKRNRKPTAAERRAHDVSGAYLHPDTVGRRADLQPCDLCRTRDHGGELGLVETRLGVYHNCCAKCVRGEYDRAACQAAFPDDFGAYDMGSDWSDADW